MSTCKGCPAELRWVPSLITGSRIPLTPVTRARLAALEPMARKHVYRLEGAGCVPATARDLAEPDGPDLYLNHFVTCEAREQFRRPRGRAEAPRC